MAFTQKQEIFISALYPKYNPGLLIVLKLYSNSPKKSWVISPPPKSGKPLSLYHKILLLAFRTLEKIKSQHETILSWTMLHIGILQY